MSRTLTDDAIRLRNAIVDLAEAIATACKDDLAKIRGLFR